MAEMLLGVFQAAGVQGQLTQRLVAIYPMVEVESPAGVGRRSQRQPF